MGTKALWDSVRFLLHSRGLQELVEVRGVSVFPRYLAAMSSCLSAPTPKHAPPVVGGWAGSGVCPRLRPLRAPSTAHAPGTWGVGPPFAGRARRGWKDGPRLLSAPKLPLVMSVLRHRGRSRRRRGLRCLARREKRPLWRLLKRGGAEAAGYAFADPAATGRAY